MKIKDRPEYKSKPSVVSLSPDTPVTEAVKIMSEKNFGSVLIAGDDQKPVGILTERDLMKRLLYPGKDPKKTLVSDIMTTEIKAASPEDDVIDWLRQMSNERFRHLPIVDEEGKILSMMSQGDFVSYTWPVLLQELTSEAKRKIAPNYQIALIIAAIIIYAIILPLIYHIFN